ncbi:unnamed protein product [Meganyctiphanes norvegica]|uniref:rhomboid protease n=1 Tax=Meganyctiphanes norvegica TaxID=48144 RepID=A0AAV2SVG3_MEGNR
MFIMSTSITIDAYSPVDAHQPRKQHYADHYRCWPAPLFCVVTTVIQICLFAYYCIDSSDSDLDSLVESPLIYRGDKRLQVWRFITYGALHAGWPHLVFNVLVQLLVGLPLEMVHGSARVACLYLAGVVAGSLGTSVFDAEVYLVGASGGVYALLAAHLANVLVNYSSMQFGVMRLIGISFVAAADMGFAVYDYYTGSRSGLPVSYIAHMTGALAGLSLGLVVLKRFQEKPNKDHLLWWVSLGTFTACAVFAVTFNLLHPFPYQGIGEAWLL